MFRAVSATESRFPIRPMLLTLVVACLPCKVDTAHAQVQPVAATLPSSTEPAHPLDPALKIARDSLQHSQAHVQDYTALLSKRCRVGGNLGSYQHVQLKVRNRRLDGDRVAVPMSVYMKFLKPSSVKGREVIWVEGRNEGKLVAHETGLKNLFRLNLDPRGSLAMRGQRYPITEIGIEKLVQLMIEKGLRDRQHGECDVQIFDETKVDSRSCRLVRIVHPVQRPHFDFHQADLFFDVEWNLPVRYASWSWPAKPGGDPQLEEEYNYTKVQINVGLTDRDFDPDNSDYNF